MTGDDILLQMLRDGDHLAREEVERIVELADKGLAWEADERRWAGKAERGLARERERAQGR